MHLIAVDVRIEQINKSSTFETYNRGNIQSTGRQTRISCCLTLQVKVKAIRNESLNLLPAPVIQANA